MHLRRVAAPSLASRVHDSAPWPRRIPAGPEPRARRKGQVRRAGRSALHLPPPPPPPGAPEVPRHPRPPALFVTALCYFLFAASRPRLTSRAGKQPKAASFSETPPPAGLRPSPHRSPPRAWEATRGRGRGRGKPSGRQAERPGAPLPGTRGRCAAVGAARGRGSALLHPGARVGEPTEAAAAASSSVVFVAQSSLRAPTPRKWTAELSAARPLKTPQVIQRHWAGGWGWGASRTASFLPTSRPSGFSYPRPGSSLNANEWGRAAKSPGSETGG